MNNCRAFGVGVALGTLLVAIPAVAQTPIFKWIDTRGNLHATDRLADVPEPYHSMYRAKLRALEEERAGQGQVPPPSASSSGEEPSKPAPPSLVDLELRRQAEWKARVAEWRAALTAATAELEAIQTEHEEKGMNPILRLTPQVQTELKEIETRQDKARTRLETARKMLLTELPARAKREGVPLRWLE